jgi:photosystem II protein
MEFIKGTQETAVPDVKLTRSKDGSTGTATFFFENPDVFAPGVAEAAGGDITGLYMLDEEGVLSTVDVSAKFLNGKPAGIEAKYTMKSRRAAAPAEKRHTRAARFRRPPFARLTRRVQLRLGPLPALHGAV